jgi:hypothetical protein
MNTKNSLIVSLQVDVRILKNQRAIRDYLLNRRADFDQKHAFGCQTSLYLLAFLNWQLSMRAEFGHRCTKTGKSHPAFAVAPLPN